MTPRECLARAYRQGYSVAEIYILLSLNDRPGLTLTDIHEASGFPVTTVHSGLLKLLKRDFITCTRLASTYANAKHYILTDAGRVAVANFLQK